MISFFLLSLLVICSIFLYLSLKKNLELVDRIQQVDEAIQDCVTILEEQIAKMDSKTKLEVFSDEPVIRELINDMSIAKEAVSVISSTLDGLVEKEQDDTEA